ncbi:glycosyltransferase [Aquihabitans sp. G128]|uniref:glycosyltransferase n=1 Tax=Aquihabitans sp. G128 TaxID=2849779 RepID=UPI001C224AE6|nr:glycosyltransferase [Aquihabitans sp. G128]QXC62214.1 glycosyltransferase [Aquihabitans sp. G128]
MSPGGWSVGVVVPARNETATIEACLASILAAPLPAGSDLWIVVVADGCDDDTAGRARRALGARGEVVVVATGNVGAARRVGARRALDHLDQTQGRPPERTWLLTTDADSTVPGAWIEAHLGHADAGAEGVAGTVAVASFSEHPTSVPDRFAAEYVLHPDGTHPHVHGANLGARADAYVAVGGWAPLRTGEDHDLWNRLRAGGAALVTTIEAPVTTSGRRTGRAPSGFAARLLELAPAPVAVEAPDLVGSWRAATTSTPSSHRETSTSRPSAAAPPPSGGPRSPPSLAVTSPWGGSPKPTPARARSWRRRADRRPLARPWACGRRSTPPTWCAPNAPDTASGSPGPRASAPVPASSTPPS